MGEKNMNIRKKEVADEKSQIVFSQIKDYDVVCLHSFPIDFFEHVPKKYVNDRYLFFREPLTHASLVFDMKKNKVILLRKKEYWDQLKKEKSGSG